MPVDSHPALAGEVQREAERALYEYLNPFVGGPGKKGWPFGRALHLSELFGLLQRIPGVEYIESIRLRAREAGQEAYKTVPHRVTMPDHGLICSAAHVVTVRRSSDITG